MDWQNFQPLQRLRNWWRGEGRSKPPRRAENHWPGVERRTLVSPARGHGGFARGQLRPRFDVCEGPDAYRASCELPGVEPGQIDLHVSDATLTLRAEGSAGRYYRQLQLPRPVEPAEVAAELVQGVLQITLPKRAQTRVVRPVEVHELVEARAAG